jgi:hypothetical protein
MKKLLPVLISVLPLLFGFVIHHKSLPVLPSDSNTWFSGSGLCVTCHNTHPVAMRDAEGNDVSPVSLWRSTMLANASKDPFWLAKVRHEGLENPSHQEGLENVCTRCHAPMGMINAFMNDSGNYTLDQLSEDVIGQDGISCTVCHQVSDFNSPEFSGVFEINLHKEIYGPYPNPLVQQMLNNTGYRPVHNDQISNSRLCGSCHTLFTHSVFENGEYTGEVFVEQALYHEWENSRYPNDNTGCQTCHMPRIEEPVIISSRPGFLGPREPYGLHTLTGGNVFMLQLLKDNHDELGIHAGEEFLQQTIERTRDMLTKETIDLAIDGMDIRNDTLYVHVSLQNKAGHKFPTGFPSRRAYLECVVEQDGNTLFHSGYREASALTDFDIQNFEPHHEVISRQEQVQIYEFVMGNTEGEVTTVLERAHIPLKDNRILPEGFRHDHLNYDTVQVVGNALFDQDYHSSEGVDRITYAISLPGVHSEVSVSIKLHYETVPESWLQQMFDYSDMDEDINRFRQMYDAADSTPVEIASDTKTIMITSLTDSQRLHYAVYPNPSDGNMRIDGVVNDTQYTIHAMDGRLMRKNVLTSGVNQLHTQLPPGEYLFVIHDMQRPFSAKLIVVPPAY